MTEKRIGGRLSLKQFAAAATVVLVLGVFGALALARYRGTDAQGRAQPTFLVRQGPLTISVTESGTIKSQEQVSLKSEVEGQTTLIYLIPEGTLVSEGTLLVELDASNAQDNLTLQQIALDKAEAAFITARENLAVVRNQAQSDISKAQLDFRFAKEDVDQYQNGQLPQDIKEAEANITLAREEMERASEKLKWSQRLYTEKYISQTELEADRLTHQRAQLNHELAVASLELLREFTSKRKIDELVSNVDQTSNGLTRVELKAGANIIQAEADYKAKDTEQSQQRAKLEKIQRQIAKAKIYAPRAGLVVYATSVQTGGGRMRNEPLQEGQTIRERQELIYLPSAESMMAVVQIHESSLEKVDPGLPVRVTVDALVGKTYTGQVAKIAPLPDAQSAWLNPDLKVYPTEIHLADTDSGLRTGMTCRAEIIVEQHADAVYVPVQAVLRLEGKPTVYVRQGNRFEPRPIEIGLDNNAMVHVLAGLTEGEEVLLVPPLEARSESVQPLTAATPPARSGAADGQAPIPGAAPPAGPPSADRARPTTTRPGGDSAAGSRQGERSPDEAGQERGDRRERFQNMSEEERAKMRERFQNMSEEERAKMRERFQNMTPEEREEAMRKRRQQRPDGENNPGGSNP